LLVRPSRGLTATLTWLPRPAGPGAGSGPPCGNTSCCATGALVRSGTGTLSPESVQSSR